MASPADWLDRTARQVRIPGGLTHRLAYARTNERGRVYGTDCARTFHGFQGALLTTDAVNCSRCNGTAVRS